jgi:hypothetical protein
MSETLNDLEQQLELARMLAKFKLQVRRSLDQSVDLERLKNEPAYARQRLAEIEEATTDEELLVSLLLLRDRLALKQGPTPARPPVPAKGGKYLFGARG